MQQVSENRLSLTSRYGKRNDFLETFHSAYQEKYSAFPERCYFGSAPLLSSVNREYGRGTAEEWLTYQLTYVSEFCGAKDKLTRLQIEELARVITRKYHWLKVAELMLFFQRLKEGEYGRFYGSIDPQSILIALQNRFLQERYLAYERKEQEEREIKQEDDHRKAITYEQYLEMKKRGELKNL